MEKVIFRKIKQKKLSVDDRKRYGIIESEIRRKANAASKGQTCLICNKPCSSFCDSHSIPRFVLNKIAFNGLVLSGCDLINPNGTIKPSGIGSIMMFHSICDDCDSTFFKEYETPYVFKQPLTSLAINEIAIKNYLRYIDKRTNDLNKYRILLEEMHKKRIFDEYLEQDLVNKIELANIDIKEFIESFEKAKRKKNESLFYVIDEIDLDYNVQFAYQGFVALINGFDCRMINDVYNYNLGYKIQRLGIAIFPSIESTKIVLFCKNGDSRLRLFYKEYRQLSLNEKLYVINYILLLYEEEWCIPASFDIKKLNEETLALIGQTQDVELMTKNPFISDKEIHKVIKRDIDDKFIIKTEGNIYNFLANDL